MVKILYINAIWENAELTWVIQILRKIDAIQELQNLNRILEQPAVLRTNCKVQKHDLEKGIF